MEREPGTRKCSANYVVSAPGMETGNNKNF